MRSLKILLVDEDEAVRDGLSVVVETQNDLAIVGEAEDRAQALKLVAEREPDVVVMDLGLPNDDGLSIAQEIAERFPAVKIVVFSAMADRAKEVAEAGFSFHLKGCPLAELLDDLRELKTVDR